jgi:hypothetical protein
MRSIMQLLPLNPPADGVPSISSFGVLGDTAATREPTQEATAHAGNLT